MRFIVLFPFRLFHLNGLTAFAHLSLFLLIGVTTLARPAQADEATLKARITALFTQGDVLPPQANPLLTLRLLTPSVKLATLCATPALSLSGGLNRLAGTHSVIAQCGAQRRFIQVSLEVTATWWQAARLIQPGQTVLREDIRAQRGSLAPSATGLIFDPQRIIGRIAQRRVAVGEALVEGQLRQQWMIAAGQKVEIRYTGNGFSIHATGKALDNAALNARLRIRTASGQIITATAIAAGKARLPAD